MSCDIRQTNERVTDPSGGRQMIDACGVLTNTLGSKGDKILEDMASILLLRLFSPSPSDTSDTLFIKGSKVDRQAKQKTGRGQRSLFPSIKHVLPVSPSLTANFMICPDSYQNPGSLVNVDGIGGG